MGPRYAGVLGPVAFATLLIRGLRCGATPAATVLAAWLGLLGFAALGYVVGRLAEWIVEQSVRWQFEAELAALETRSPAAQPVKAAG